MCVRACIHEFNRQGSGWYVSECLYLFLFMLCAFTCLSEHIQVCVCMRAYVNWFGGFTVLASWLPLTCTPLSQSTYPCPLHHTDLGYCPAQSTLESSTSPCISMLITTHVNIVVPSVKPGTKQEYITKEVIVFNQKNKYLHHNGNKKQRTSIRTE